MEPQPPFAEYPRGQSYGTPEKLAKLRDAYFGVYWIVAGTVVFGIGAQIASFAAGMEGGLGNAGLLIYFACVAALLIVNFFIAFRAARLVAEAKDRPVSYAIGLAIGTALLSPCCFGLIGCIVIQSTVTSEVKKYGLAGGKFLGLKKRDFDDAIARIQGPTGNS